MSDQTPDIDDARLYGPQGHGGEMTPPPRPRIPLKVEEALAALAMAAICAISLANVVVRYATDVSFAFTEEYSVFLLVAMTFLGAAVAFARHEHIKITFLVERLPARARLAADLMVLAVTTGLFAMVIYYGATFALDQWRYDEVSAGLGYPAWIYTIWLPILGTVILLRVLERAWLTLRRHRQRQAAARDRDGAA